MSNFERSLKNAMRSRDAEAPAFDTTFDAAVHRVRRRSQAARVAVPMAAAVATVAIVVLQPGSAPGLVSEAELLGSTSWTAPSDELLPSRQFDIYQDVPDLAGSTKLDGETL